MRSPIASCPSRIVLLLGAAPRLRLRDAAVRRARCRDRSSGRAAVKSDDWKQIATAADEARIARLGLAWQEALADARRAASPARSGQEGELLDPQAALPRPAPTPGSYNCRLIKLGKATARAAAFESFKPFFCYVEVEGDLLTIVKQTGSQRPAGRLWEDDDPTA